MIPGGSEAVRHLLQYTEGTSIAHRLDPRTKILSVTVLSASIFVGSVFPLTVFSIFFLWIFVASGLRFRRIYEGLRPMAFFLCFIFLLHIFTTEGGGVRLSYDGLCRGALVTWRFTLVLAWASILTLTTSLSEMVAGMGWLLSPLRIVRLPSHEIAFMISTAIRFVPALIEEIDRVKNAQLARGAKFGKSMFSGRAKAASRLMWPVILGLFRRADRLATAVEARGYREGPRTYMKEMRLGTLDLIAMGVVMVMAAVSFAC